MKRDAMIIGCTLVLALSVLSFTKEKKDSDPNMLVTEHANENVKFEHDQDLLNNETNTEDEKKAEEGQDKGEGQIKIKF